MHVSQGMLLANLAQRGPFSHTLNEIALPPSPLPMPEYEMKSGSTNKPPGGDVFSPHDTSEQGGVSPFALK